MTHVVFRVGPLQLRAGATNAYFVHPGISGLQVFFGTEDRVVLTEIIAAYEARSVYCEAALAAAAHELGLPVRDLTTDEAHTLGLVTFDLVLPGRFERSTRRSAITEFALAAARFSDAAPWTDRSLVTRTIGIQVTGCMHQRLYARLLGATGSAPGLVLFRDEVAVDRLVTLVETQAVEEALETEMLGMTLEDAPPFARDAMLRAYGLGRLPMPLESVSGMRSDPDDCGLLVLAGALRSISSLSTAEEADVTVAADDLTVRVIAR